MWFQLRSPELAEDFERLMASDRDIVRGSLDTVSDWRLARPADVPGQSIGEADYVLFAEIVEVERFENAEGSMSKLKAGEVAVWATERAIQILGGNGYTREFPVERWHRDAKIYDIFEGTAEIQQLVISRAISGMHIK